MPLPPGGCELLRPLDNRPELLNGELVGYVRPLQSSPLK